MKTWRKTIKIFAVSLTSVTVMLFLVSALTGRCIGLQAEQEYSQWKQLYIVQVDSTASKVVNPQDQNVTVSEGMGYGMLFSVALDDADTFARLWKYVQKYMDKNGLMHWKIDATGKVIGEGSATDADQDIVYALYLASQKWNNAHYLTAAKKMLRSISKHEIGKNYLLLPGDAWGTTKQYNPSYFAPAYCDAFAALSKSDQWKRVFEANTKFLSTAANAKTGLLPDWIGTDGTTVAGEGDFGYDAVRVPIRLLQYDRKAWRPEIRTLLRREYTFFSQLKENQLVAGYQLSGEAETNYLNKVYLASITAVSGLDPSSTFHQTMLQKLKAESGSDYFGDSLKLWTLLILSSQL